MVARNWFTRILHVTYFDPDADKTDFRKQAFQDMCLHADILLYFEAVELPEANTVGHSSNSFGYADIKSAYFWKVNT